MNQEDERDYEEEAANEQFLRDEREIELLGERPPRPYWLWVDDPEDLPADARQAWRRNQLGVVEDEPLFCDMGGFHVDWLAHGGRIGWAPVVYDDPEHGEVHDHTFIPYLLVRVPFSDGWQDAHFCEDCTEWLRTAFTLRRD